MLNLDDARWEGLKGGYRQPYDARPALTALERAADEDIWLELWNELHHQGDVGEASYAAVPHLVRIYGQQRDLDWNMFALVSVIEVERHRKGNPPIPAWLREDYVQAWRELELITLQEWPRAQDPLLARRLLGVLALAKGELKLGALISTMDQDELDEVAQEYFAWSDLYRQGTDV